MTVQYEMKVTRLDVYTQVQDKENVVFRAYWTLSATDGVKTFTYPGKTDTPYNPNGPFQDYEHLSEPTIIDWIDKNAGREIASARASLALNFPNEPVVEENKPLPWN